MEPVEDEEDEPQWLMIMSAPPDDESTLNFRLAQPLRDAGNAGELVWYYANLTSVLSDDMEALP